MRVLKSIALFIAIVIVLLAVPLLFLDGSGRQEKVPEGGHPWQVEKLPDGFTRVFGLVSGQNTLNDARSRIGQDAQVALIIAPGESGSVEAYFESFLAGTVTGKMVLTLETTVAQREQMLTRARKAEYMKSSTRKIELGDEDLLQAGKAMIAAIAFIPSANLDEQIILQRFGAPVERLRSGDTTEHFLYPEIGLDLRLDSKGKEVLQYVAPRNFASLRDPLVKSAPTSAAP